MKLITLRLSASLMLIQIIVALYIPWSLKSSYESVCVSGLFPYQYLKATISNHLSSYKQIAKDEKLENWIIRQEGICIQGILDNIGGISKVFNNSEITRGAIIASPSKSDPDYFYQWTRDSALTVKSLIYYMDDKKFKNIEELRSIVESYIVNSYHLQRLENRSGKFSDAGKNGLGEPKFYADNNVFNKDWGRPQRDGPGLRAITVLSYLSLLEKYSKDILNEFLQSKEFIYHEIVKPDLVYVINNWDEEGFDLWEEINSFHFFGSITQLRAIKDGLIKARQFDQDQNFLEELERTFNSLTSFILKDSGYVSNSHAYLIETPSYLKSGKRSGLDSAILLGSIHSHNVDSNDHIDIPFDVNDGKILSTLNAMVADMKYRYPINHDKLGFKRGIGAALGRYPEDVYDGHGTSEGNPWFLSTAVAAEVVYKFLFKLNKNQDDLIIDSSNKLFFEDFINTESVENDGDTQLIIPFGTSTYKMLTQSLFSYSDSFLEIVKEHVDKNGHISEQFNKNHGYMQGARDLTWSYSAVWNSFRWRKRALNELSMMWENS